MCASLLFPPRCSVCTAWCFWSRPLEVLRLRSDCRTIECCGSRLRMRASLPIFPYSVLLWRADTVCATWSPPGFIVCASLFLPRFSLSLQIRRSSSLISCNFCGFPYNISSLPPYTVWKEDSACLLGSKAHCVQWDHYQVRSLCRGVIVS